VGEIKDKKGAFIPRHGRGHYILPTEVNSQANIYALKLLGVKILISISACGSLKEEICPRDVVLPDQLFDRTKLRKPTFFGNGVVGHISFDEPYCYDLRKTIFDCCNELNLKTHFGGTYVCIEGPQFSTKAESNVNRQLGFSIVGMTALPEAKLAREAEMCYATIALVTDYDVWKEGEEVTVSKVIENLNANVENSKKLIVEVISKLNVEERKCRCNEALKYAIFTKKDVMKKSTLKKLDLLIGKYIK
jgi:5'-methylthioadenosine phosphorylase